MSENCTHDCSNCSQNCSDRQQPQDMKIKQNEFSNIKKVIAVMSGKGGVGKSLVTSLLASSFKKKGYNVGILDADITGPSIPKAFGINEKAYSPDGKHITPAESKNGIKIMSINLLLEDESDPVVWRGPVIAGAVKQFWSDVTWGEVDYMFVDMPPGTGDVPLTVFQSLPIDGIVVVTSPQDLVSMIVGKAVKMANLMGIPVVSLVENLSYFECPDCGKKINVFGESKIDSVAEGFGIGVVDKMPINSNLAESVDKGNVEELNVGYLDATISAIK